METFAVIMFATAHPLSPQGRLLQAPDTYGVSRPLAPKASRLAHAGRCLNPMMASVWLCRTFGVWARRSACSR
ncbi:hypothetical protein JS578_14480 (plasmid) [Dysgonomonadaceae bacterium zrk40]|nr:hypothetical protein JS578_14480 [Dysgonomonadaceae bacterium zrk40]